MRITRSNRLIISTATALTLWACGDDDNGSKTDTTDATTAMDTTATDTSDDTTATDTTVTDTTVADTTATDTTATDTTATDTTATDTGTDGETTTSDAYLVGCDSLFSARVVEKQIALDATFPNDCDTPLRAAIGAIRDGGPALCNAGESANACRTRLYTTPPPMAQRSPGCAAATPIPDSCLVGKYTARCADGTDNCTEPEAICQDGTRPMVYAEAATTGPSDVWFFWLGGEGGPCTGPVCWYYYRFAQLADDVEHQLAMSTAHPDHTYNRAKAGAGVMNGLPVEGNGFAAMNRVHFKRCTDAASDAIEIVPIADGVPAAFAARVPAAPLATRTATVPVWHHGFDTWRATFHLFTTDAGRDLDGDGTPDLPSLANAKTIVLAGSSDASMWVVYAGDELAKELRAIAGPNVDVRLMVDGHFEPSLDNEARYHPDAPANFDSFTDTYAKTGLCALPDNHDDLENETCSDAQLSEGGGWRKSLDTRGVVRDASCDAMHGANAPECYEKGHVLAHHVATPVLVLADQEDATISGSPPVFAEDPSYHWADPTTYRRRVLDLANDFVTKWATAAREEGAGVDGKLALALPKSRREGQPWGKAQHVRFGSDDELKLGMTFCSQAGEKITTVAFGTMVAGWVTGTLPTNFAIEDGARWGGVGAYFVTGATCRTPE